MLDLAGGETGRGLVCTARSLTRQTGFARIAVLTSTRVKAKQNILYWFNGDIHLHTYGVNRIIIDTELPDIY